jgi:hypothetical protein
MKNIAANVVVHGPSVAAGATGALLGDMAGFGWQHWLLLAAVIVLSIMAGALFVAAETSGRTFWSAIALKMVMGFAAAMAVGGNLKALVPICIGISVLSPAMLRKTDTKFGGQEGDGK